ncbi:lipopolysaccharide heptosyltransferase II [Alteromonas gilva]|uniref:lipopolysaccharide heptosyltransferase II n=1 Tax=Alteromonas gilva TaxID=2987522 RepID=A0ABT5L4V9_9ALTE|nr:lipopolysaccharide heptosyltransferase II [Alteromonas gilva]MDC8832075.1 lipopolysaccharide heptosyltransferase II [Alteromonas gilva]
MSEPCAKPAVLIIRLSAMGDIVMASGLPSTIKKHFTTDIQLIWMVESPYKGLVENHPDVNGVICWPKQHWRQLLRLRHYVTLVKSIIAFRKQLRAYRFDLVIDAQGLLKSALLAWLTGARKRIGFKSKEYSHWLLTESHNKPLSSQISSEYVYLGARFSDMPYTLVMPLTVQDRNEVDKAFSKHGINGNVISIAPYTTRPQKHWTNAHWHCLIKQFLEQEYTVVILGGPQDKAEAERLCSDYDRCYALAGQLSMTGSAAAIERSRLLVGVDTGLTHMAIALNRPAVALFGSTRPYTRTHTTTTRVLYTEMACAPCKRHPVCHGRYDCMQQLTPQRVIHTATELLR